MPAITNTHARLCSVAVARTQRQAPVGSDWEKPQLRWPFPMRASRVSASAALCLWLGFAFAAPPAGAVTPCGPASIEPTWLSGSLLPQEKRQDGTAHARLGSEAFQRGDLETAGAEWVAAAEAYARRGDVDAETDALLRAAAASEALGGVRTTRELLERARTSAQGSANLAPRARVAAALARADARNGDTTSALRRVDDQLAGLGAGAPPNLEALLRFTRAEVLVESGDPAGALRDALEAERLAERDSDPELATRAAALGGRAAVNAGDVEAAAAALERAGQRARLLSDSDTKAELLIHLGRSYEQLSQLADPAAIWEKRAAAGYLDAAKSARAVDARRSESFAIGNLGALYARAGRIEDALVLTRRAIALAPAGAAEASYRWHLQLARLLREQGDSAGALAAYERSVRTLDRVRETGIALPYTDIEPIYFDYVDLLLLEAARDGVDEPQRTALLLRARDRLEDVKSVELNDYFQDACVSERRRAQVADIPSALVVYPVVLPERTELIASRGDDILSVAIDVRAETLAEEARAFRELLQKRTTREYRRKAADLYDLLIRPLEPVIGAPGVEVLVFVPGGPLRTIPMSALYDREAREFLVEKVPVAVVPALTLTTPESIDRTRVSTLAAGLTEAVQGFSALEAVGAEIGSVDEIFGAESLLDEAFVTRALEEKLGSGEYGIVHIATHGKFEADGATSYLVTWDGKLGLDRLARMVERTRFGDRPIELLTLSACETAAGDERSALGLAGVAVRAGASSALATLWTVNDQASADLVAEFYRQLVKPDVSRAEALRRAQLSLIASRTHRHPGYWAPFLLISNWM